MTRTLTTLALAAAISWGSGPAAHAHPIRVELTDSASSVRLEVEIEWGSIRIRGAAEADGVTIEARADRPDEVAGGLITASETGNLVTVRQTPLKSGVFRSAHLEITTPRRTSVDLRVNRGGDVWVQGLEGLVEVTNLNGSVQLAELSGAAAVNASNGSILAGFSQVDRDRDLFFGSLNGSVELCLPPDFSARVHLTTAGDPIRSGFRIEAEQPALTVAPGEALALDRSEVRGRIGSAESRLRVSTLNGEIRLERCD